jgi:murein DD-endopeptidase MepM/ murein hydrolase activator NlpD
MPGEAADSNNSSPEERRTLERLAREAANEARRSFRAHAAVGRSPEGASAATTRRWFRRVALRLALVAAALMLLMVVWPPVLVPVDGSVTSRFFLRTVPESPFFFDVEAHRGLDIGAPEGSRVGAARTGRVVAVRDDPAYGLVVDIRHPLGVVTRYAHLSRQDVRVGQWVWRGRRIGAVGMTGRATGPHLHFEIRVGGRSVPPGPFLVFHQLRRAVFRRS